MKQINANEVHKKKAPAACWYIVRIGMDFIKRETIVEEEPTQMIIPRSDHRF